jgi:photosystem II stability/assembly factor-like uncharacterized protein
MAAGLVTAVAGGSLVSSSFSTRSPLPASIAAKVAGLERAIPVPYGAPGQAQRYDNAKRLPLGRRIDTRAAYARAEQHTRRVPMYSTAEGRLLNPRETRVARLGSGPTVLRGEWESLGPTQVGGRTRTIVIDPRRPETMYLGGVSGGVWKTSSGGGRWHFVGEELQNIAINSMVMHPEDSKTLLVGTGEGYFREDVRGTGLPLRGGGIFRTTTGGNAWSQLPGTAGEDFWFVNDLVYSADGRRIYAATRTGVHRSSDGGDTWKHVLRSKENGGCLDLAMRTDTAADVLFASCGTFEQASIYRSVDAAARRGGAAKFKRVLRGPGMGRTSIAIAPSDQDVIYALAASNRAGTYEQALHAVFRSDAGGARGSWEATVRNSDLAVHNTWLLHNPILMTLEECGLGASNLVLPMGWYVNALAVDPVDPDRVWAGGVDWFRSSDGGRNWAPVSYWWSSIAPSFAHADQHVLVFHPDYDGVTNQAIYIGNDGGIAESRNAAAALGSGRDALCNPGTSDVVFQRSFVDLAITQFYHGMPFASGDRLLGGTQDNGTRLGRVGGNLWFWPSVFGGDGGYVAIDPRDPDVFYVESQNGNLAKTTDGGATMTSATAGLPPGDGQFLDPGGNFVFITPFVMDPVNPDRLWIGGRRMYRTDNGAALWQLSSTALKGRATAIAVAPADNEQVAAGTENGFIYVTDSGGTATGATAWSVKRPRKAWVTWVAFDPEDSQVLYATYGGFGGKHVYRSTDGGKRWRSIDGEGSDGLPDIPAHVVLVDPEDPERLFLGTDLGVFVSIDGGGSWAQENAGFGNIVTESLHLQREGRARMLYAFTHGRGAWRVRLKK